MDKNQQQEKDGIMKSLAIVGFVGLIIVISWLGIQLVQVLPSAISSLASLADSVYNYEEVTITAVSNKTVANVDESFTISWEVPARAGTFVLSYECSTGLSVDLRDASGIKSLACDTNYNLGTVSSVDIIAYGERDRFTDFIYTIDFIPNGFETPAGSGTGRVSIVNPTIDDTVREEDEDSDEEVATTTPEKPVVDNKPAPQPTTPTYTYTEVYRVPVSDPNGFTDLQAKQLSVGEIVNGKFVKKSTLDNDSTQGAVQFEVKNIGTKTSATWSYTVKLPNGETYKAPMQNPLKPSERMTITIGFAVPETPGVRSYNVNVSIDGDSKLTNNSFTANVMVSE